MSTRSSDAPDATASIAALAARLRAAGCVFAEEEAAILLEAASDDPARLEHLVERRATGEPLEHLVGWVHFGSLRLSVGPGVFIPRQRTLRLARAAVRAAREQQRPVVLEPFCGVAPLAAAVAESVPDAEIHVADIDPAALEHARRNLPAGAGVHLSDGLAGIPSSLRGRVTLVAAVPPYIPSTERRLVPHEALEHEPEAALFAGPDGLRNVGTLIDELGGWLAPEGVVLIELNRRQYRAAAVLARRSGWTPRARRSSDGQTVLLELRRA
ncbi:release factor glutamine methyltransferase [Agromyces flavus]|uniref:Release factor glutamine methyltransferase n=1 Tax=Agromyces flavus TaxID=589382 RepID=A0A1H1YUT6_9MICO|nr:methyltransferase [Agromyces flavus]MCP2366818.1 release factor glutamine methyltransferase [Agromyces flavus]GGI45434.1 methylase of HemK family protein [Agromyces flavus]SDT25160.1 release factor glutamine methyltransferase [Agromyces flavus]